MAILYEMGDGSSYFTDYGYSNASGGASQILVNGTTACSFVDYNILPESVIEPFVEYCDENGNVLINNYDRAFNYKTIKISGSGVPYTCTVYYEANAIKQGENYRMKLRVTN